MKKSAIRFFLLILLLSVSPAAHAQIDSELEKSAKAGNAEAQYRVGMILHTQLWGVENKNDSTLPWMRQAAAQNHIFAKAYLLAYDKEYRGDGKAIVRELKDNAGSPVAKYWIGNIYCAGRGVPKNQTEGVKWYTRAAEEGDALAQKALGVCYHLGYGVQKDLKKAVFWFRKAAEQGFANAQNLLGVYYEKGYAVQQDLEKAVFWFRKAAEQGYANAQNRLGFCYYQGNGVQKDLEKAVFWWQKAAEQGHVHAQYNLGDCYAAGDGVQKDLEKASFWHQKADRNSNDARERLARLKN